MRTADLPPVFRELNLPHVYKVGSEYRGPCPKCRGDDRFVMWERSKTYNKPLGWCRQCGYTWSPEDTDSWTPLTEEEKAEIARRRQLAVEKERAEIAEKREMFQRVPYWQTYYHNLEHYPRAVQIWRERYGIRRWALDYYKLGYCPDFCYFVDGVEQHTDTLTIPCFKPATEYEAINLRHRLLDPEARGGKYRPHAAGLGQPIFFANLNRRPNDMPFVLLVEGAIKAAVIWQAVLEPMLENAADAQTEWFCHNVQVVGVPGTSIAETNLPMLEPAGRVYIAFDPDANERHRRKPSKAELQARAFEGKPVQIVHLPGKPDDLIVDGALTIRDLVHYMKHGRAP